MSTRKVLIVDDDDAMRRMLHEAFKRKGYEPTVAESAEAALEVLEEDEFPAVFLDLNMHGMNGLELCRIIRKTKQSNGIYAITGFPSRDEFRNCRSAGFDCYFTKPLSLEALFEAADECFQKLE